jgi:hypothetical protein
VLSQKIHKVSLNIKVTSELDLRLKRARKVAREIGLKFNVSEGVEAFLTTRIKTVERELGIDDTTRASNDYFDGSW